MDAKTIYNLMKPYLSTLDIYEKKMLSNLITQLPSQKVPCHHGKVVPLAKAKEKLRSVCSREMEKEKQERNISLSRRMFLFCF